MRRWLTRAAGRSTRSRWIGRGGAAGHTLTTTRSSRFVTSGAGSTGRGCHPGLRAVSRMRSSTKSSPSCPPIVTGHWSPFTSRPAPGLRNCCQSRLQELPASTDAFVWLRLYQMEMDGLIPEGRRQPLWWMLRRPVRPLTYHAAHRMFERAGEAAGSTATLPLRAIGRKRWTSCSGPDVVTEVVTFPGITSRPSKAQRESARTRFPPRPMVTDWPGCWTGWLTSRARPGSASSPVVRGRPAPDNHGGSSRNAPRWAPIGPVDGAGVGVFASARSGRPRDDPSYGPRRWMDRPVQP